MSGKIKDQIVFKLVLIKDFFEYYRLKNLLDISKYFLSEPRLTKNQAQVRRESNRVSVMIN